MMASFSITHRLSTVLLLILLVQLVSPSKAQSLTDEFIQQQVSARLAESAKASWELGTRAQAILSLNATPFSVLSLKTPLPPPNIIPNDDNLPSALDPFFEIARNVVINRNKKNTSSSSLNTATAPLPQPLIQDGSAADPASIGFAVVLANWTNQDLGGDDDTGSYAQAAQDQLDFLLTKVPRTSDGAISHRVSQVQLWSDFVYMVPPFLAYHGTITQNRSLLLEAHNQIRLYHSYLFHPPLSLWKHVLLGTDTSENSTSNDEGCWSTGNAWAAAGMLRVLGTFLNSGYGNSLKKERGDLVKWIGEIHEGMFGGKVPGGVSFNQNGGSGQGQAGGRWLFGNYADRSVDANSGKGANFEDAASTALMVATVYRYSLLAGVHKYLPVAERIRKELSSQGGDSSTSGSPSSTSPISSSTSPSSSSASSTSNTTSTSSTSSSPSPSSAQTAATPLTHFTPTGWLHPVVNPHAYGSAGAESPEAQAFVLEMHAAWRDWVKDGSKGANAGVRTSMRTGVGVGEFGFWGWWMIVLVLGGGVVNI